MAETKQEAPAEKEPLEKEKPAKEKKQTKKEKSASDKSSKSKQTELEEKINLLEKDLAAAKEAHIRTLAEYDNYRKRSTREKQAAFGDSKAAALTQLLPVLDNFERALALPESDLESFKKGVEMIYNSFGETLKKLGVEAFGEEGEAFDPNIHNGVMHIENEELAENSIAQVFSKGYRIGERILRPAMVQVAN